MAVTNLVLTKISGMNTPVTSATAVTITTGADGGLLDFTGVDNKVLISVGTANATIKAGDGIQGVNDLAVDAGNSVVIESGRFKKMYGTNKGKVLILGTGSTTTITATELP